MSDHSSEMPLTEKHTYTKQTNIHAISRIRTHDPSTQAASFTCLRPHGHPERSSSIYQYINWYLSKTQGMKPAQRGDMQCLTQNRHNQIWLSEDRASRYILITKPTRCTNSSNLFLELNSTCFGQVFCPSSGV